MVQGRANFWGPNSFIFMPFSAKILQINRLALWELAPLRKILDPPLQKVGRYQVPDFQQVVVYNLVDIQLPAGSCNE